LQRTSRQRRITDGAKCGRPLNAVANSKNFGQVMSIGKNRCMNTVLLLIGFIIASIHFAEAQQKANVPKIGWLGYAAFGSTIELFRRELRELGYVEGKNIAIEVRSADNMLERLSILADELARLKVDVLVVPSTPGALAAKQVTRTIPIVFIGSGDPVAAGLIDSMARPGGNITGFTTTGAVLAGKRLELLKETIPNLSRVAVLWNSHDPTTAQQWKESELAAWELKLQLYSMEVSEADKYEDAFKEATKARSAALAVTHSAPFVSNRQRIADLATKNRLPAIDPRGDYVASGGLMAYGVDEAEPYRRAASIVAKILKGAKPADLPVEQPTKFEMVINLKAAKQMGVTIPPNVLARADKVIK
jgi:putative tryptophan/tyrosine transport system substrate-binding protein